ncbi:McrC family protein [Vibrio metschnikovii]|uniref:McrC family protein n=1 Tax=Vibrio metschnikovii TaxID=28172 RepID=UPI001C2F9EC1|nr:McrC family protein [Vibrio metschnikovii]
MHTTVFEYGYLTFEKTAYHDVNAQLISKGAFEYLKEVCLGVNQAEVRQCFDLVKRYGFELIQVKNYVGVILTPSGEHIEVLPKIGRKAQEPKNAANESRDILLMMLQHLRSFRHIATNQASVNSKQTPLLEVFIEQFLCSVNLLVKRGLKRAYVAQVDNLNFQKGKLLVPQQIKRNTVNRHKFYVEYDEYLINSPANRLIKTALEKIHQFTKLATNQKLLQELKFVFVDIPCSHLVTNDINALKIDRSMRDYDEPLSWATLILENLSPLSMKGSHNALSLLFPMERVFESYVASVLRHELPVEIELKTQASSRYLLTHYDRGQFQLKPDLLITKPDNSMFVLDTKWKLLDLDAYNYGLSQADLYQMFAYGYKYLNGVGDLYLIYPAHDGFTKPIGHSFDFSDSLKLWVVPFDLSLNQSSCLDAIIFHKIVAR